MANGLPMRLSPFFGNQASPFPPQAPQAAPQQQGFNPTALLGLQQGLQGFLQAGQRGGLGEALLGLGTGALGGVVQGRAFQQQRQDKQAAAQAEAQQQALENLRAQEAADLAQAKFRQGQKEFGITEGRLGTEAERKAAADAENIRQFGVTENRLGQTAAGNLAVGQGNLGLRRQEFERGRVDPLVEVFDPASPTGSRFAPRSEAAGQPSVGSFSGSGLTPKKAEELGAQAQSIQGAVSSLDRIIADIRANPERAGGVGAINKFLQTGLGIGRDIVDLVPGVSSVTEGIFGPAIAQESDEVRDFLTDQSIERNQTGANSIAYALAARRKAGTGGKVTVKDIDLAFDDLQLTGLKSTAQKIAQLEEIRREFVEGEALLRQRVAAAPGGVAVPAPSAASATQADLGTMSIEQLMQLREGVAGNP